MAEQQQTAEQLTDTTTVQMTAAYKMRAFIFNLALKVVFKLILFLTPWMAN